MHYSLLVIGENVEQQLAPFQENDMDDLPREMLKFRYDCKWYDTEQEVIEKLGKDFDSDEGYWQNPNAKWDWWEIGGRFGGRFKNKQGERTSQIIKNDIDFDLIYKEVEEDAIKSYQEIHAEVIQGESFISWDDFMKNDSFEDMDERRKEYHRQNVLKRAGKFSAKKQMFFGPNLVDYLVSQKEFVKNKKDSRFQTFAILKDGVWIDEYSAANYKSEFKKFFESIGDNELITIIDYHD